MKLQPYYLYLTLVLGILSIFFAKKRGYRNPYLYFFVGFLFGLFGIAFLMFGKSQKNVETSLVQEKPLRIFDILESKFGHKLWYYLDESMQQNGPVSASLLEEKLLTGQISSTTYVWNEELDEWKSLDTLITS